MTSRGWRTCVASLGLFLSVCGHADAQDQPRSLLPGFLGSGSGSDPQSQQGQPAERLFPQRRAPADPSLDNLGPAPAAGPQTLGTLPLDAATQAGIGLLDPILERYTGPLPAAPLQVAARELLLDPSTRNGSNALVRGRALYALGFLEDATGAAVEGQVVSVADRAAVARMFLGLGRIPQACERADVDQLPEGAEPGPTFELLEVLALCQLEQGQSDAAKLIVDLLRDQGGSDRLYRTLIGNSRRHNQDVCACTGR